MDDRAMLKQSGMALLCPFSTLITLLRPLGTYDVMRWVVFLRFADRLKSTNSREAEL